MESGDSDAPGMFDINNLDFLICGVIFLENIVASHEHAHLKCPDLSTDVLTLNYSWLYHPKLLLEPGCTVYLLD